MKTNLNDLKRLQKKYENRFFYIGVICGLIIGMLLGSLSSTLANINFISPEIKTETNKQLLNYIDGKWISAVNDMQLEININDKSEILILELLHNKRLYKKFKVVQVKNINGVLGLISLNLCEMEKTCDTTLPYIPLQINKIFGRKDAIIIAYDYRLAECTDLTSECVRAFSRFE